MKFSVHTYKRIYPLPIFFVCILLGHCLEKVPETSKTLEIPELGIILNYEGWIYEEYDPNQEQKETSRSKGRKPDNNKAVNILFYLFDPESNSASPVRTNINFVSEPVPTRTSKLTLEDYVASIGALYSNLYKGYEMLSVPQRWDLGKNKAMFIEAKFQLPLDGKIKEAHTYQWVVLKDDFVYIFTGTTPESEQSNKGKKITNTMKTILESKVSE